MAVVGADRVPTRAARDRRVSDGVRYVRSAQSCARRSFSSLLESLRRCSGGWLPGPCCGASIVGRAARPDGASDRGSLKASAGALSFEADKAPSVHWPAHEVLVHPPCGPLQTMLGPSSNLPEGYVCSDMRRPCRPSIPSSFAPTGQLDEPVERIPGRRDLTSGTTRSTEKGANCPPGHDIPFQ